MSDFDGTESDEDYESGEDYADAYDNDESWDVDPQYDEDSESYDEYGSEDEQDEDDSDESENEEEDSFETDEDEVFPNGHTRQDYLNKGFTNNDIATWGLDQNAAPDPDVAWMMILDSLDDYQGEKKAHPDHGNDDLNIFR